MAQITFNEMVNLITRYSPEHDPNSVPAKSASSIVLGGGEPKKGGEGVYDESLAGQTITYEGYRKTLVLDFDSKGILVALEFV